MKCSRCHHENRTGANFCEECAAPLERACSSCGALVSPTAKFCPECAHPVGRAAAAQEQAERATALARAHRHRGWKASGLKLLGDIHALAPTVDPGTTEQATVAYRQALALVTELGMRPLVAHCHLDLAKLYRKTNKREQAQEHFTTATGMYREMDMRFWLERAELEARALA